MVLISDFLRSENLIRNRHVSPKTVFICNVITFKAIKIPPQYENTKTRRKERKREGRERD